MVRIAETTDATRQIRKRENQRGYVVVRNPSDAMMRYRKGVVTRLASLGVKAEAAVYRSRRVGVGVVPDFDMTL